MTGVLIVNMGSPTAEKEMKHFLFSMFCDGAILPFPKFFRIMMAFIISNLRYKKSWKKYEIIGGSPLIESVNQLARSLGKELGAEYVVNTAYSYSYPTIEQAVDDFWKKGFKKIKVIPLYPQSSFSTTGSIWKTITKLKRSHKDIQIIMNENFSANESFINYWISLINESIGKNKFKNPTLLFSAHAIPLNQIEKGDTYVQEINIAAHKIASKMGLPYKVSFQSKMGKVKWIEPDTKYSLKILKSENVDEIIIVPISFITENLETLYDLDVEIVPYGMKELKIENLCRVEIPKTHTLLINMFKNLITGNNE